MPLTDNSKMSDTTSHIAMLEARYRDASYYVRMGHHRALLDKTALTCDEWERLSNLVFVILKPDALARGLGPRICDWLRGRGYSITFADMLWSPRELQFESLYQYNLTLRNNHNQLGSWWLNRQLYTLGPSLLLLIDCPVELGNVYQRLANDKGPSDPLKGQLGQLRFDFQASNMTMNLFHCSDDPFSTVREFLIFRTFSTLQRALVATAVETAAQLAVQFEALPEPYVIDASLVARRLALRLLIECKSHEINSGFKSLPDGDIGPRSRLKLVRSSFADMASQLTTSGLPAGSPTKQDCLKRLLNFPDISDLDMLDLINIMRADQIQISDWEALVLVSTCHYVHGSFRSLE